MGRDPVGEKVQGFSSKAQEAFIIHWLLGLYVKSLKEGRKRGFDPSLRKHSIKSSLARHTLEPIFKVR